MADTSLLFRLLARDDTQAGLSSAQKRFKKFEKAALVGAGAIAGGLLAVGKAGMEGVLEGVAAEEKFQDALSRSSGVLQKNSDKFKEYAESVQKSTKFTYEDTLGVGSMIAKHQSLTGIVNRGMMTQEQLAAVTLDLATVTGKDAASSADALGKALGKPASAAKILTAAGVALTDVERTKLKEFQKAGKEAEAQAFILDLLKEKTEGAATAAGDTMAGKMERAKNAFGEVQEGLVVGLMPAVTKVLDKLLMLTSWAQENPGKMRLVATVLGIVAGVLLSIAVATRVWAAVQTVASAATKIWAAGQWLLNAALNANPIGLTVLAIAALIAIIVIVVKKTSFFSNLWKTVWGGVQSAVSGVVGWVKKNWPLLLAIITGPIGAAVLLVTKNFDKIKGAASAIKDAFSNAFGALTGIVKSAINGVIGVIRKFGIPGFKIPVPFAPDISFGGAYPFAGIPGLAKGGFVTRGGATMVGEKGPEILSLPTGSKVTPLDKAPGGKKGGGKKRGGSGGRVEVVLRIEGADKALVEALRKHIRIQGGNVQAVLGR